MTQTASPDDSLATRLGGVTRHTLARLRKGATRAVTVPGAPSRTGSPPRRYSPGRPGERGVSEVIGFILIFGLLILGLTIIQLYGVPATNERLEFEHNQRALGDVGELSELFSQVTSTDQPGSLTIEAGMTYPSRLFLFNPGPVSGSIRTANTGQIAIENAHAAGDAADSWNGDRREYATSGIEYSTLYNLYDGAPTRNVEHGLVYDRFDSGNYLTRNQAPFIEGRTITLVTLTGDLDTASAGSILFEAAPLSVPGESLTVSNPDPNTSIGITLPSGLGADEMRAVLEDELEANGGYVQAVQQEGAGTLRIDLTPGASYDLTLANLRVGTSAAESVEEEYLVAETPSPLTVAEGTNTSVELGVRDRFNNPVSGVRLTAETAFDNSTVYPGTVVSDGDGRARFEYVAPADVDRAVEVSDEVRVTMTDPARLGANFRAETPENVSIGVRVQNTDRSGIPAGPNIEPGAGYGGVTVYDLANTTQTFAVPNGQWRSIDSIERIVLSNGELVDRQVCLGASGDPHDDCRFVSELRLSFTLWNASGAAYGVDVQLLDTNRDGDFRDVYNNSKEDEWSERRHVTITDANENLVVFERKLSHAAIADMLSGGGTNILQESSYKAADGTQTKLDLLKLVEANWFTATMHGRLDVQITG